MSSLQAMFHHPIIAIQSGVQNFSLKSKPITLKLAPGEFEKIKDNIKQQVDKFTKFTDATINQFDLKEDTDILKYQEEGKRDILISALAPDFLSKYHSEILYEDSFSKLSDFLTEKIGSQSASSKSREAEDKMHALTRDSSSDEKFARFLIRLTRLAEIVTDKPDVQQFLINKNFRRILTPQIRTFLQERGKNKEEPEKIAEFLDALGKNKRMLDINSMQISPTSEEILQIQETITNMRKEMRELLVLRQPLEVINQRSRNFSSNEAYELDAPEVHALRATGKSSKAHPKLHAASQESTESFPGHWELNRYGRPYRCRICNTRGHRDENCRRTPTPSCRKCGLRNHRTENCRGTTLICHTCNKAGHIQQVCPQNNSINQKN